MKRNFVAQGFHIVKPRTLPNKTFLSSCVVQNNGRKRIQLCIIDLVGTTTLEHHANGEDRLPFVGFKCPAFLAMDI